MSTATFLKSDTATQGAWYHGTTPVHGADGWGIPDANGTFTDNPNWPSYATITNSGTEYTWVATSSDVRALEYSPPGTSTGSDAKRIASAWYGPSGASFTFDIKDGNSHQIAMYFCDWDSMNRKQQVQITDDLNGNAVLDTRDVASFSNGIWLVWLISGKVTFTISETTGSGGNALVTGVFFDTPIGTLFLPIVSRPRFEPAHYE